MLSANNIKAAIIYTTIVVAIFCVPSYFAVKSVMAEERYKALNDIMEWIDTNENNIFAQESLDVPQSVRFKINIYDEQKELIYNGFKYAPKELNFKTYTKYPNIYYQKEIKKDKNLYYIVVELELNYSKIIFVSAMLLFAMPFIVFLISNLVIDSSVYPYKVVQKYMDDFFNDTMHELKTPLGIISINLELMSRNIKSSKHMQRIKSAVKQMQMTYEDIEYYIKHKMISYPKETVDFSEYLKLRMDFFADIAAAKSITIESECEPMIFIRINKIELQRLIDNNISNAIKYSFYQGNVKVILRRTDDGLALFSVQDQGEGIQDIKKIFKRFKREDTIQGGFGIGLNIVQNVCDKNDITIDVKSAKNQGSVFTYMFKPYSI
jgi:two-component sensor histidine kinase